MLYLITLLIALTVALLVFALAQGSAGGPTVARRLHQLGEFEGQSDVLASAGLRRRRTQQVEAILVALGDKVGTTRSDAPRIRQLLVRAGFYNANAVGAYWAVRIGLTGVLVPIAMITLPLQGMSPVKVLLGALWCAGLGWVGPTYFVSARARRRQGEVQRALADVLDLLVVCVEAGLGLNQALLRVAQEIGTLSPVTREQFLLLNLEIRAGTSREDAMRNLAARTGVQDVSSLVSMLIQTDRFGTSVAEALRIHADTIRTKRRQRAEEAGAKTSVKLLFPLIFFIFPSMFVVILGPAIITLVRTSL